MREMACPVRAGLRVLAPLIALALAACQASEGARLDRPADSRPVLVAPPEATAPAPPPVPAAQALFSFEAILGVPTTKADSLSRGLGSFARARNLTLVRRGDPTATYRVLGFLSAVGGTGDTTVSYVWDIVDASGKRVHRITGIELAGEADADPWSGVDDEILAAIAERTVERIYAWVNQSPVTPGAPTVAATGTAI
jgi:hypothetical protein